MSSFSLCTRHQITHIIVWLYKFVSFFSLPEFWGSKDVDVADLSLKVIILFFTLMCSIKSFRFAPGTKIHILQTVFFLAMCFPEVFFSAMLYFSHLSIFSQSIFPMLSLFQQYDNTSFD